MLGTLKWRIVFAKPTGAGGLSMAAGLILIGIGPGGIGGMTRAAINAAKNADFRRYEAYTALWNAEDLTVLENEIGQIHRVMRPEVEEPVELLALAKQSVVALLIVGDPLQATTHVDLQLQAGEAGVDCSVIHGVSITGLVTGAVGLSNYRFGRQTTLTYPYGGWIATSPLEVIALNRIQGLHTLALLDLDPTGEGVGGQRPMQPVDAATAILNDFEIDSPLAVLKRQACEDICDGVSEMMVVLCSDMGTSEERISYLSINDLPKEPIGRLHCLVIPAEPSDVEVLALKRWTKK